MQWCKQAALAKHIMDGAVGTGGVKREKGKSASGQKNPAVKGSTS